MCLTLDALIVLDARAGSFAGGAEQLFRVPSAVSYTIHKLEQDLGVTIFDLEGIGHNVPQEAPDAFAKAVLEVDGYSRWS
jgi:DNA-binding transcriptional LysR family regulator